MKKEKKERRFILDTSVFTNPNARKGFGNSTEEAVKNFLKFAAQTPYLQFYMPLSIKKELTTFVGEEIPFLESVLIIKSPALYELSVPAAVVYRFIDEIRYRIDKGLRVSEQLLRTYKPEEIDQRIHDLREKYRSALRDGVVDSKEDFDVVMLAKEVNGIIVTADYGLMNMADWLGLSFFKADRFHEFLIYVANKQAVFTKDYSHFIEDLLEKENK
ncbi:MAG: RNA ligase partner protein [Candidatus Heimdallarchaeaceae archaeon]